MSLTSERARNLVAMHLHLVFPFGVSNSSITFSHNLAATCLANLEKEPVKASLVRRTDLFVFEEIGLLSAEYFSALDNVLRLLNGQLEPNGW